MVKLSEAVGFSSESNIGFPLLCLLQTQISTQLPNLSQHRLPPIQSTFLLFLFFFFFFLNLVFYVFSSLSLSSLPLSLSFYIYIFFFSL